jgi:hypothetical protein
MVPEAVISFAAVRSSAYAQTAQAEIRTAKAAVLAVRIRFVFIINWKVAKPRRFKHRAPAKLQHALCQWLMKIDHFWPKRNRALPGFILASVRHKLITWRPALAGFWFDLCKIISESDGCERSQQGLAARLRRSSGLYTACRLTRSKWNPIFSIFC